MLCEDFSEMSKVYLSLGTNLGDKEANLCHAVNNIEEQIGNIVSLSAFYVTPPWGYISDNDFLNAAVCVNTDFTPLEVLQRSKIIEKQLGRASKSHDGVYNDRLIDIDILLYDNVICSEQDLILPHPLMEKRRFVMEPLAEIAPDVLHPVLKKTMKEINADLVCVLQ